VSYYTTVEIKELLLRIPKSEFPLNSDVVLGVKNPCIVCNGGDEQFILRFAEQDEVCFTWRVNEEHGCSYHANYNSLADDLAELVVKYKGTLIAEENNDEEGGTSYIRIRDGVKKTVKIVEGD
jgi:hypothetical protein